MKVLHLKQRSTEYLFDTRQTMSSPHQHDTPVRPLPLTDGAGTMNRVTSPTDPTCITSLMNNTIILKEDLQALERYVKEVLFYKIIFIQDRKGDEKGSMLSVEGPLYQHFTTSMTKYLCRGKLVKKPANEVNLYVEKLWTSALDQNKKGSIQKWMEVKRSNIYCAMQTKFDGKYIRTCLRRLKL